MQLKPLHDLVLVKREGKATKTSGGLLLPETSTEESLWVRVIEVGTKVTKVKPGQLCLARQWCGYKLEEERGFQSLMFIQEALLEAIKVED